MALTVADGRPIADAAWTLPRTRKALSRFVHSDVAHVTLWWVAWVALLNVVWVRARAAADDVGFAVHGDGMEHSLFGGLPGLWLQEQVHGALPSVSEWGSVAIYTSWFFVPVLAAIFVSFRAPRRIGSFFGWWVGLYYLCLIAFVLFPMAPPWMADPDVKRLAVLAVGDIEDGNQVAAMPSLHVALPVVLALWFVRERWKVPAMAMFAYAGLIALEVVVSGEHYVVDVLGAVIAALAVSIAAPRIGSAAGEVLRGATKVMRRSSRAIAGSTRLGGMESGQALIEVALVLPLIFVILAVLVDGGLAVDRRLVLQHAVREGGRQGALGAAPAAVVTRTVDQAGGLLDPTDVTVCYIDGPDGNSSAGEAGDSVRVQADYTYHFTLGSTELLTAMGGSAPSIDMTPKTEFVLETNVSGATGC